jgi:hypothetical protein
VVAGAVDYIADVVEKRASAEKMVFEFREA